MTMILSLSRLLLSVGVAAAIVAAGLDIASAQTAAADTVLMSNSSPRSRAPNMTPSCSKLPIDLRAGFANNRGA